MEKFGDFNFNKARPKAGEPVKLAPGVVKFRFKEGPNESSKGKDNGKDKKGK